MNINELKQTQDNLKQQGGNLLGSIISWKVTSELHISWKLFQQLIQINQIPSGLHPNKKAYHSAFKKAVSKCRKVLNGYLLRYIKSNNQEIVLGIVSEKADVYQEVLEYNCAAIVKLENDIISEKLIDSTTLPEEDFNIFLIELKQEIERQIEATSEDIRLLLRRFTTKFCVRINPNGGGYFCPSQYQDLLNSIKQLVKDCDAEKVSQVYSFELYNSPQNQNDMGIIVQQSLEEEIKSLAEEINHFKTEAVKAKTYDQGLELRNKKVKELETRVNIFKEILDFKASELELSISQLQSSLTLENPLLKDIEELENSLESELNELEESLIDF